jgi:low temperature requirement protein LtrA
MPAVSVLRARSGVQAVSNIEVFVDLVYVFAVTQLSHYARLWRRRAEAARLGQHPSVRGEGGN